MIREKQNRRGPIVIDLTGPDGNDFALMGYARSFGKQLVKTNEELSELTKEMMSGDYENLLEVFDREFGSIIILER